MNSAPELIVVKVLSTVKAEVYQRAVTSSKTLV